MKKIIAFIVCIFTTLIVDAQVTLLIDNGAHFLVIGSANVVMDTGSYINNGSYIDSSGIFKATGGIAFSGTGTSRLNNFIVNNSQTTNVNTTLSVYNTATLTSGYLNANNSLYIRSDNNDVANMVVTGVLNNTVKGIIARASVTSSSGCAPFSSNLSLNISGSAMVYDWQSSEDSLSWANIIGATGATYTATVTATKYYRCRLTTNNSSYGQFTPGVKISLLGVPPVSGTLSGVSQVCVGSAITITPSLSGGAWSSSNSSKASVSSSGVVTGVSAGSAVISYTVTNSCGTAIAMHTVTVNPAITLGAIGGSSSTCAGSNITLTNSTAGGIWSSTHTSIATVSSTGILSGIMAGTTTISYTVTNGCGTLAATRVVTVIALPDAGTISGATAVCRTTTTTLSSTAAGGTWSSSYAAGASVNTSTGLVTGLAAGSFAISYRMVNSCGTSTATFPITVLNAPSLGAISGTATVCASVTTTLANTTAGGTWSSTNTSVATIAHATIGVVTGVAGGTTTISYNVTNICGSATATRVVTVNALPVAAVITGTATLSAGTTITLTATPAAGTWLSGSGAIASVNASGVVTGVSAGIATISYNRSNTCGIATATVAVTVTAATTPIAGTRVVCQGATTNLTNATAGGTWSTADGAIATVGATGVVSGVATGTTTVTYTFSGGGYVTATVTVNAVPAAYTGSGILCIGSQLNLGSSISGCTWTSLTPARASVASATGVVTGVALGTVNISYVNAASCRTITQLTVNAGLAATTGVSSPCTGSTITLSNATSGGTWSSSNTARATIDAATGLLAAISGGTVTISYTISAGCVRTTTVTVGTPTPITGNPNVCLGQTSYMSSTGGTWSGSNNPAVASLAASGFVTGVSEGTAVITYRSIANATCFVTQTVTVNPLPSIIVPVSLCPTETATLTSSPAGGTWTSTFPLKASVNPASGLVTAIILNSTAASVVNIVYTLPTTCSRTAVVTVNQVPAPIGGGVRNICVAANTALTNSTSGGTWSSASPSLATVTAGGVVTGASAGLATISYSNAVGCASTAEVTVNGIPGANSGTASLCRTATTTLSNAAGAGTWSSSNSSTASVGMSTGVVTGTNVGTANITYSRAAGCISVTVVTVNSCARPGMTEGTYGDNSVFTVSPNPTTGAINLTTSGSGKVVIYTIDGKQLQQYEAKAGTTGITLPSGLANGVYMLRFNGANGSKRMVRLVYQQ